MVYGQHLAKLKLGVNLAKLKQYCVCGRTCEWSYDTSSVLQENILAPMGVRALSSLGGGHSTGLPDCLCPTSYIHTTSDVLFIIKV